MTRFRKWLIRKLGGYTEQTREELIDVTPFQFEQKELTPYKITVAISDPAILPGKSLTSQEWFSQKQQNELANIIGTEIITKRLYEESTEDLLSSPTKVRKIVVRVIPPTDYI